MDDEKPGETRSVYFKRADVAFLERHAAESGRSFSWAVRDLLRRGQNQVTVERLHRDGTRALK